MKKSHLLDYLFGYDVTEERFASSGITERVRSFRDKLLSGAGKSYAKKIAKNPITRFFDALANIFCVTAVRTYSLMLLSFGLLTLLINFGESYFLGLTEIVLFPLIVGSVLLLISIPLFFFDIPLCEALKKNSLTDYLLFELFCLRRVDIRQTSGAKISPLLGVLIGAIIAAFGYFLSVELVLFVIGALLFLALTFSSPEFCFMLTILVLPLIPLSSHPTLILAIISTVNLISFFIKVLRGKRLYHFELYDFAFLLFFLFILAGGIFRGGAASFGAALAFIALASSYFLAGNLIVNRRLADNAVGLLLFSSVPVSIYGIVDYFFFGEQHPEWVDGSLAEEITVRATSTFGNPNIYSVFLIVVLVFSAVYLKSKKTPLQRLLYLFLIALNGVAMALTFTRGAWIALIITALAMIILKSRSAPKLLLIPLALIPLGLAFIPEEIITRLLSSFNLSDSSITYRLSIFRSSLVMFLDNIFTGVGIGEVSFSREFLKYAEDGVTAPHSHNVFLQIACEGGIFALILFLYILLIRVRHLATYSRYIMSTSLTSLTLAAAGAVFALMTFGMTDYIFHSPTMCYLFFTLFGLCSATLRISKNEHDKDLGIAGDLQSEENASLNISLNS